MEQSPAKNRNKSFIIRAEYKGTKVAYDTRTQSSKCVSNESLRQQFKTKSNISFIGDIRNASSELSRA